jgi:ribosome-associated toxin RatA of RatAB toxin-antitoxin module
MILFSTSKMAASFLRASPVTKRHGESRILRRTHPLHLFRIIQDVDQYQEFLPLCRHSQVLYDTIRDNGRKFDAKLIVGKPPLFSEEYISRVTVVPEKLLVESESIASAGNMFESLKSWWQLRRVDYTANNDVDTKDPTEDENRPVSPSSSAFPNRHSGTTTGCVGCHVDFQVEMTVTDPVIIRILDTVLMQVAGRQVEAFDKRCQDLPWPEQVINQIEQQQRQPG